MKYLSNAFSLQMVATAAESEWTAIAWKEIDPRDVPEEVVSCIGHPDTAAVVSNRLCREVPCNRTSITLEKGDLLYVAQIVGGRLPEGATTLPENITLKFLRVEVL